jgi:hypothetical protein
VIVCPKCRQHAQIIETGKNTLRCQCCGTILEARKLRILYSSEELADAVAFRTRFQAEISGNEYTENIPEPTRKRVSEKMPSKKDRKSIILGLLESSGGKIQIEEFQQKALEKGISLEKFDLILKELLEIGELYSPEPGIIKLL